MHIKIEARIKGKGKGKSLFAIPNYENHPMLRRGVAIATPSFCTRTPVANVSV
ncbi:MAG: hypothetical protein HXY43_14055 [Fischerella sp.]|jgi:hypothetical protein|uniref:hypothetical protein n=1 Tax=Fischerella sp. TaxID=1191 RepID=UPI0017BCA39B|nr:hypothetical protein [Fischerella sp.]NWF60345.1 hypothetical protein [Fischerella sp.]